MHEYLGKSWDVPYPPYSCVGVLVNWPAVRRVPETFVEHFNILVVAGWSATDDGNSRNGWIVRERRQEMREGESCQSLAVTYFSGVCEAVTQFV
jgi:hypothetical protein